MDDLIRRQAAKVSITRYFEVHVRNQKSRRLKEHAEEICRDICFGIDAWPSAQPEPLTLRVNHELTKEEYDKLMHDIKDAPIVLLPPSADVVEVVRCKDCKHLFEDNGCPLRTWWTHTEDDFCSYAERRTE